FEPHVLATLWTRSYQRYVVMTYLDNLIAHGDHLFEQFTRESVSEALQLYILALQILGPRPNRVEKDPVVNKTYAQLASSALADEWFIAVEDSLELDGTNGGGLSTELEAVPFVSPYFCFPPNPKLLGYWDTVEDR